MNNSSDISVRNGRLSVEFASFDLSRYDTFLKCKLLPESEVKYNWESDSYTVSAPSRFAHILGVSPDRDVAVELGLSEHLFDYERFIVETALESKRYACWADTGLGKTQMGLEYARQVAQRTAGRVLIVTPLNIVQQWIDEAAKFYPDIQIERLHSREAMKAWCASPGSGIAITNPEKFIPPEGEDQKVSEVNLLAGLVLDESSLLKSGGGVIKWALIHSARGIEYKLSLTATPAPNDTMEYASQGSFLEKLRNEGEILWTFFVRTKDGNWKVKDHARQAFYRFMSSWSIYLRSPARYGFADNLKDLPAPELYLHEIPPTPEQITIAQRALGDDGQMRLFRGEKLGITSRARLSQAAKGFLYLDGNRIQAVDSKKPDFVAQLIREDARAGHQVLVWTVFDAESTILFNLLRDLAGVELLTGSVSQANRVPIIERFRTGRTPVMITRASILGHGLNFQNCTSMVFSGFDDSFERFYQAIRRAYRYGQTRTVRVHVPFIKELEGLVWNNLLEKQAAWDRDTEVMERCYVEAMKNAKQI